MVGVDAGKARPVDPDDLNGDGYPDSYARGGGCACNTDDGEPAVAFAWLMLGALVWRRRR